MNFDEQKLKGLDNIRLNDNQYENVIPITSKNLKKAAIVQPFFLSKAHKLGTLKSNHLLKF